MSLAFSKPYFIKRQFRCPGDKTLVQDESLLQPWTQLRPSDSASSLGVVSFSGSVRSGTEFGVLLSRHLFVMRCRSLTSCRCIPRQLKTGRGRVRDGQSPVSCGGVHHSKAILEKIADMSRRLEMSPKACLPSPFTLPPFPFSPPRFSLWLEFTVTW